MKCKCFFYKLILNKIGVIVKYTHKSYKKDPLKHKINSKTCTASSQ